jgi:hypothetical protein
MRSSPLLRLFFGAFALAAASGCSLNPQPLPPGEGAGEDGGGDAALIVADASLSASGKEGGANSHPGTAGDAGSSAGEGGSLNLDASHDAPGDGDVDGAQDGGHEGGHHHEGDAQTEDHG